MIMSLPTIRNATFTIRLKEYPKPIKIRPMIVAEHKSIQQAIDIGSEIDVALTISEITAACTDNLITGSNAPQYILDYLFLQLYMTSVENMVNSKYTCHGILKDKETGKELIDEETKDKLRCNASIDVKLPLDRAHIMYPDKYEECRNVAVNDEVSIRLKGLSLASNAEVTEMRNAILEKIESTYNLSELENPTPEQTKEIEDIDKTVDDLKKEIQDFYFYNSVEYVQTAEGNKVPGVDFTREEFLEWLNNCPSKVLTKIQSFYEVRPTMGLDIDITCPECGNKHKSELRGLQDFFS